MEFQPSARPARSRRNLYIAGSVVLLHVGALWALQTGLLRRAAELVVPVELLSQIITPPQPKVEPPPPAPKPPPRRAPEPPAPPAPPPPAPQPVAIADPTPAPAAPTGLLTPQPPPPPIAAPVAVAPAPVVVPAPPPPPPPPPKVELPSTNAEYLRNPTPPYPALSKRLGEQGLVVVRVLIDVDGTARQAQVRQSSGFDRLDQAALQTVLKWRYVPGRRGGVPEAMWFNVPINFVLE